MDFVNVATNFLGKIWTFVVALFEFLTDSISGITKLFDYIVSVVFELPTLLMTIFNYLPDFMQVGLLVITVAILFVFVMKIIRIFRESLAK